MKAIPSIISKPCVVIFSLCVFSCTIYAKQINKTIDIKAGNTLNLRTDAGSIEIDTHKQDTAIIEVDISGKNEEQFEVTIEQKNKEVLVIGENKAKQGWGNGNNPKVKYFITLPQHFDVELKTAGGSISIEDLQGDIDANTSGGSIRIYDVTGDVDIHTSGGSIKTNNVSGKIDAHTSGGSINAVFSTQPEHDASFTTSGGSIHARLPSDAAFELDASTSGGRISSDFDVNGRTKKQSIRGTVNGGGPEIELKTSGGSVSIDKR